MILVTGRGSSSTSRALDVEADLAAVDAPGLTLGARDGHDRRRSRTAVVPSPVPTTAGMPSSRATIAAWQVRPPRLVTMAAAVFITGSQSGVVVSATSTSPGSELGQLGDVVDARAPCPSRSSRRPPGLRSGPRPAGRARNARRSNAGAERHRLGPGLDHVQLAVEAVLGPLHVHRPAVVALDGAGVAGQLEHLVVAQAVAARDRPSGSGCCGSCASSRPRRRPSSPPCRRARRRSTARCPASKVGLWT